MNGSVPSKADCWAAAAVSALLFAVDVEGAGPAYADVVGNERLKTSDTPWHVMIVVWGAC